MKLSKAIIIIACAGLLTAGSVVLADTGKEPLFAVQDTIKPLKLPLNGSEDNVENTQLKVKDGLAPAAVANVYKFKQPKLDAESVKQMARKFGVEGTVEAPEGLGRSIVRNGQKIFWMDNKTGKWAYEDLRSLYTDQGVGKPNIPSDRDALKIAEQKLKESGINLADFSQGIISNVVQQAMPSDPETILSKDIYFYKKMNGKPLLGVSRLIVNVGHNGEVQAVKKLYKDLEEQPIQVNLKSAKQVLEDMKSGKAIIHYKGKAKGVEISKIEVAYWEDAGSLTDQPHLQPIFIVRGKSMDTDQAEFESYVPAVDHVQAP